MRKLIPTIAICLVGLVIVGFLAGGVILLIVGINTVDFSSISTDPKKEIAEQPQGEKAAAKLNLQQSRQAFKTVPIPSTFQRNLDRPKPNIDAQVVDYTTGVGRCVAYLSKPRKDGLKRPAVVWAHGGFGGISEDDWKLVKSFHDAGCVLMIPSFRGENDNRGQFEMFYGEVDDLLAAVNYVANQSGVDPSRIYVAGHSSGGTLALLAATTGTTKVRAIFSIAGLPDVQELLRATDGLGYNDGSPPFDYKKLEEGRLRSAIGFVSAIKTPTYFIGPLSETMNARQAVEMERRAGSVQVPFKAFVLSRPNQFNIVVPVVRFLAPKLAIAKADDPPLTLDAKELDALFIK